MTGLTRCAGVKSAQSAGLILAGQKKVLSPSTVFTKRSSAKLLSLSTMHDPVHSSPPCASDAFVEHAVKD